MSNTIRRPRNRPRVKSINFRALWWAMRMEGAYRIRYPRVFENLPDFERRLVLREPPSTRWARTARVLRLNEARRCDP